MSDDIGRLDDDFPIPEPEPEPDLLDPATWERGPGPEYSLWRNGVQLAVLRLVHEEVVENEVPYGIAGWLLPVAPMADVTTVKQMRLIGRPGDPIVHEGPWEPPGPHDDGEYRYYYMPPEPQLDAEGRGLPPEKLFELRTEDGRVLPTNLMEIERIDLPDEFQLPDFLRRGEVQALFRASLLHAAAYPPPQLLAAYDEFRAEANRRQAEGEDSTPPS